MPIINVTLVEDVFTPDQKREIIERLTDVMSRSKARTTPGGLGRRRGGRKRRHGRRRQAAEHRRRQGPRGRRVRLGLPAANHGRGDRRSNRRGRPITRSVALAIWYEAPSRFGDKAAKGAVVRY